MPLEQEIKQIRPFGSQKSKALVNLIYTSNWIYFKQNQLIKEYDITIQQYNVLRILNGQAGNPISIKEIVERMLDKMSNASRLVDKLYQRGLVNRITNPDNRRACEITITIKGQEVMRKMNEKINLLEESLGNLNEEDYLKLNTILDNMRNVK